MKSIKADLASLQKQGRLRELALGHGIDFASNDYLGYSRKPGIRAQLVEFLQSSRQLGSTGSRLISGNSSHLLKTEYFLARCFNCETTVVLSSGYSANIGICVALGGPTTEFFSDQFIHASFIDGIRLARSKVHVFHHNQVGDLENCLRKSRADRKVILTESIFSMDGDFAPLEDIARLAVQYGAFLVVDEAHATGVCGRGGLGRASELAIDPQRLIGIHTGGKALGGSGAVVACSLLIKQILINRAKTLIYTTAPSPFAIEHIRLAVKHLMADPASTTQLWDNIRRFVDRCALAGITVTPSPIVPVIFGSNQEVLRAARRFQSEHFFVKAIRAPSVAEGSERLRITIKSFHESKSLDRFVQILTELKNESFRRGN